MILVFLEPLDQRQCSLRSQLVARCIIGDFRILPHGLVARERERERGDIKLLKQNAVQITSKEP